jgi:hypothetical protein
MAVFEQKLPVRLTHDELIERGNALALERQRYNELEMAAKNAAKKAKDDLAEIDAEIDRLAGIVRAKAEPRPVRCKTARDFERGVVETMRLDTGEIVDSRVMTEQERQVRMWPGEDFEEHNLPMSSAAGV